MALERDTDGSRFFSLNYEKRCFSCATGYFGATECSGCPEGWARNVLGVCECDAGYEMRGGKVASGKVCILSSTIASTLTTLGVTSESDASLTSIKYGNHYSPELQSAWMGALGQLGIGLARGSRVSNVDLMLSVFNRTNSIVDAVDFMSDLYVQCGSNCLSGGNQTACSCLLNICSLALYDPSHSACIGYSAAASTGVAPVLDFDASMGSWPSFSPPTDSPITVLAASFNITGQLQGFSTLRDSDLIPCPQYISWKDLGAPVEVQCELNAENVHAAGSLTEMRFFELFVQLDSGMYPIPVKLESSDAPRVRRFWLNEGALSFSLGRYASSVTLTLNSTTPELSLFYMSFTAGNFSLPTVFRAEIYHSSGIGYARGVSAVLGVTSAFAGIAMIIAFFKSSTDNTPSPFMPNFWVRFRRLTHALLSWHFVFFFVISAYWVFGYACRHTAALPASLFDYEGSLTYAHTDGFMIYLFVVSFIAVLADIVKASRNYVLFLDWEIPAGPPLTTVGSSSFVVQSGNASVDRTRPSAWRKIGIAKAFSDKLVSTQFPSVLVWILVLAFLQGAGWELGCRSGQSTDGLLIPVLQFAVPALVWLFVLVVLTVADRVRAAFFGNPLCELFNACSLANISILILDSVSHGWYIHGRAPSGRGDWSIVELRKRIQEESANLLMRRGLFSEDARRCDLQSFELFFSTGFRDLFFPSVSEVLIANGESADNEGMSSARDRLERNMIQFIETASKQANVRRKSLLEFMGIGAAIGEQEPSMETHYMGAGSPHRGSLARIGSSLKSAGSVFIEDWSGVQWAEALLYGSKLLNFPVGDEWRVLAFEMLLFIVTFRFQNSSYVAACLAFLSGWAVRNFRLRYAKSALARSSGLDLKFL